MPVEEIQDCIDHKKEGLSAQYCGEEPATLMAELCQAAEAGHLRHVTAVDVGGNALDATHVEQLCTGALAFMPNVTELDFRHNDLCTTGVAALRAHLPQVTPKLAVLQLSENKIRDEGAWEALQLATELPSLRSLGLGSNSLTPHITPTIAAALERTNLETLTLEFNALGDEGVERLHVGLAGRKKKLLRLRTLNLSDNCIGDKGAKDGVAPLLRTVPSLEVLDLAVNKIGAEGAKAIAAVLPDARALEDLDIGCNALGEEGAIAVASAMERAPRLTRVDFTSTQLTPKALQELVEVVGRNKRLKSVRTSNNDDVPIEDHQRLIHALQMDRVGLPPTTAAVYDQTRSLLLCAVVGAAVVSLLAMVALRRNRK